LSYPCRKLLSLYFGLLLLCAAFAPALAAENDEPAHFAPDAAALYQQVSKGSTAAGADVLFLEDQETVVFDSKGRAIRSRYYLYKVLTQKGADGWGDISSSWEPWHEERPTARARVITPDSAVHILEEKTITDAPAKESAANIFSDRRVLRAPLPAIAPGSLVEEELVTTERAPFFGAGTVERFYVGTSVAVRHTRLILDAPASLPLRYAIQLLPDLKPERKELDGRVKLTFEYGLIDAIDEIESQLRSDIASYPSITFSTGDSWRQVADGYGRIIDQQIGGAELKSLVTRLIAGKSSRDDKAAAIVQYLDREVRYTGVEFGEAALVPHLPSETLARKYGDCKDKASLLVAMLRVAGMPAYIAVLNGGSREDVVPDLPGMGMFDHAIVFVPGDPDLWIDATDEYARVGELPNGDQGRLALVVRSESASLTQTPVTSSAGNMLVEKREIYLAENGPARVVETSQPHGSIESSYRRAYADQQSKSVKDELTNYVKGQYLAEKLDRVDRSEPTDLSRQFELVLESNRAKRGATDLNLAVAVIRVEGLFARLPADLRQREKEDDGKADKESGQKPKKKRTSDYQLPQAYVTEWRYTITPPAGFRPKPLPANADLSLGSATLKEEFTSDKDGVVHASLRFDTIKRRLTVAEATEMRNQVAQLTAATPLFIYFEPIGQTLVNQGKVREALQSYRELIALHPKEAVHHLQIAEILLAAGLGEAARAEAQSAVKLEPTSALAEKTLANILEYDVVGRKFRPGSDYAGAEAAFRAAIKLDPEDQASIGNLAILLEYNHWGLRYGPGAKLIDAVAEYRKFTTEKLAEFGLQNNLPFALLYSGQFSEAQKNAEILNPQPTALIVACEAALHGSESALTQARKRTSSEEQFKQIVEAAGEMLANLRKYPLAADLEEAGALGNNASNTAAFAALYRIMTPHEEFVLADDPAGLALRYELLTQNTDATLDQMRALSSRNGKNCLPPQDEFENIVKEQRSMVSEKARLGQFSELGIDMALARAEPRVQGNDAAGYKVTLWATASYRFSLYVVKEDGHYKFLAPFRRPEAVGLEILDRVAANDLASARVFLDWLREDMHLTGGDDPLSSYAFPRLWTTGKEADTTTMRLAAASLLVHSKGSAPQGLLILEAEKESARNEAERTNILLALLEGYSTLEQHENSLSVATELAKQYPESERMFSIQVYDLRALGRWQEADLLANERLKRIPGDIASLRALVSNAISHSDYAKAHALAQNIIDEGKAEPNDLNTIAWFSLFAGKVESADMKNALKAAELSKNAAYILHTLGCVYAEVGKTKQAREVLIQAMDALNLDEPDEDYWYAFGRIAEQYGERAVALSSYARVTKPKKAAEVPDSPYRLAQIRIEGLRAQEP
jgi:transglutaminase-like putative cysteine protease/Flp pilus assembly protein TadD